MSQDNLNGTSCKAHGNGVPVDILSADEQIRVGQRLIVAAFCMMLIISIVEITVPAPLKNQQLFNIVLWAVAFLAFFAGLFGINKIGIGTGMPVGQRVFRMLLLVFPYVNLLTLIYVYYKTAQYLKHATLHSPETEESP